ncbi:hypothetical protein C2G38_2176201 [Gigaspora rosea]|uniref:F-box domain-containing protein n=1 Tax=Gigaspora rosea TaxID=44941 RepID=A0A397VGH0_9GLOM|nr:hypothetical protein C2G38_2176201 [Gigaspora rosea]
MASKVLMGNMPELMEKILNNLKHEFYSLYCCALVNRYWCKISIPILWQDLFSFSVNPKPLFIPIYFSSLGEDEKFIIKECLKKEGLINIEFSIPLFDYARFLKVLYIYNLEIKIKEWINLKLGQQEPVYNNTWKSPLITLPLKLFIESGATLHEFGLCYSESRKFQSEIFLPLELNVQFFSNLQHLSFSLDEKSSFGIENINKLLRILAKNSTKLSTLSLNLFPGSESQVINTLFPVLKLLIKSQKQLKKFLLCAGADYSTEFFTTKCYTTQFHGIISALESQKNSLQNIRLAGCGFSDEFEVLNNCKNLKTIRIRSCDSKLLKILDYNISTLEITDFQIDVPAIVQILEKFGIFLQRLTFESKVVIRNELLLIEALKSFCPNITYLYITDIGLPTQLLELIGNLQKLQFLSLGFASNVPEEDRKIRVMEFAKILPSTLQYLDLANTWLESFLDILLNHCNAPLKKLLIGSCSFDNEKNVKALINFCIQIGTLNYVGVSKSRYLNSDYDIGNELEKYVKLVPYEHVVYRERNRQYDLID